MEAISQAPTSSSFTPLSTHESETPTSFFSGPPVLYHHSPNAQLLIHRSDLAAAAAFSRFSADPQSDYTNGAATNGDSSEHDDEEVAIEVDIWVTSETFTIWSPSRNHGISIPYPSISLHAIQSSPTPPTQSLFLQVLTSAINYDDHDPENTISLTIIPAPSPPPSADSSSVSSSPPPSPTQLLFSALSACSALHPDPVSDSENEDIPFEDSAYVLSDSETTAYETRVTNSSSRGLPPALPGSGGWITAENVDDYFDADGNWSREEGGSLGTGAGYVRLREEEATDGGDGEEEEQDGEGEESKWRRTD